MKQLKPYEKFWCSIHVYTASLDVPFPVEGKTKRFVDNVNLLVKNTDSIQQGIGNKQRINCVKN